MTIRGILCDLDGVVYRGEHACPGAVEGLQAARLAGVKVLFMTNNASRTPADVAEHLNRIGVDARPEEVLTASQVAAQVVAQRVADGELRLPGFATVLAVGGEGVGEALTEVGLPWRTPAQVRIGHAAHDHTEIAVVVQGYGADLTAVDLSEAVYALGDGAAWIATNDDQTLPTARGLAIGNGSLLAAVRTASGREPEVVGKPHAPAYERAMAALGLPIEECLMIGDRLDTDIRGAAAIGLQSALVLTGVSTAQEAEQAPREARPDHVVNTIPDLEFLWT